MAFEQLKLLLIKLNMTVTDLAKELVAPAPLYTWPSPNQGE